MNTRPATLRFAAPPLGGLRRDIYRNADKFARSPDRFMRRAPAQIQQHADYLMYLGSLWHQHGRQVVCMSRETALELIETPLRAPTLEPTPFAIEVAIPPDVGVRRCEHGDELQSIFLVDLRADWVDDARERRCA